ncbi:hypothetical protein OXPF_14820 [Oxobacter pfennigii]|uniref:Probable membrane transporter protein n=1 Tax=Oxobacter pfennigii TaxID=36849 RepID=A0A0P8WAM7_9CLOT|nr:sulfite exporter TauE/SafE family protein [Oxobacter pfennigii]KPU45004.1 hypothetical protein OXPF_14820 [Oxobacter pfennigii]
MLIFLVSIFSGIISGMGIGGGTILIPALILLFNTNQHIAQSVNLIAFIPTAIVALMTHIKNHNVEIRLALKLIITGIIGAIAGSYLASLISSELLRKFFAGFLFAMGIYEICCKKK